MILSKVKG